MKPGNERYPNIRDDGTKQCVWCGDALKGRRQRWCSDDCVSDYQLNHDWGVIRAFVRNRDKGVCAICKIKTFAEKARWKKLRTKFTWELFRELLIKHGWPAGTHRDWWEADHIVSRHDGGSDHPCNLRTLCVPCHKAVTALQGRERKREREARNE